MGKITTWAIVVAVVVVFVGGGFTFRNIWPKTVEKVVTIDRTITIHDTLNIIKYSKGYIVTKHDTVWYQDTTTIASYEALIQAMSEQTAEVANPPQDAQKPTSKRFFGLGVGAGAIYSVGSSTVMPIGVIGIEFGKNEFMPVIGYERGWNLGGIYRRRF